MFFLPRRLVELKIEISIPLNINAISQEGKPILWIEQDFSNSIPTVCVHLPVVHGSA